MDTVVDHGVVRNGDGATTAGGRVVLWVCAAILTLAPLGVAAAIAPRVPIDWLAWLPWVAALAITWLALAPK
jgi:hypothetical protein